MKSMPTFNLKHYCILCMFLSFFSCRSGYGDIEDVNTYLNNADNGCLISKTINNIDFSVKYIPPSYVILKNLKNEKDFIKPDSLLKNENNFLTFIMTISPTLQRKDKQTTATPIMYEGLVDEGAYADRVFSMNFALDEYIRLYSTDQAVVPVAAFVENLYELSNGRNFFIVFPKKDIESLKNEQLSFIFKDPYYNSGTLQFHFDVKNIEKANNLKIDWGKL